MATGKWGMATQIWRLVNQCIRLIELQISDVLLFIDFVDHVDFQFRTQTPTCHDMTNIIQAGAQHAVSCMLDAHTPM